MSPDNSDLFSPQQLLAKLLKLGKCGHFEEAKELSRLVRLTRYPSYREVLQFSAELSSEEDLSALIKAIAKFEGAMGGGGSPSMNYPLLLWGGRGNRETLDWVLRNCRWYYSKGAKSLEEYERIQLRDELHSEEMEVPKLERHLEAFRKKAKVATASVCGAICRGDARAIAGLMNKGADPDFRCPDGSNLRGFIEMTGSEELHRILEEWTDFRHLIRDLTHMGREGSFAAATELGARCHAEPTSGVSILIEDPTAGFRDELPAEDFEARAKALAMFEMGYGWRGTKSFIALLAYRHQGDNRLFDWILRDTSGWHYARGNKSLEEFENQFFSIAASNSPSMNPQ